MKKIINCIIFKYILRKKNKKLDIMLLYKHWSFKMENNNKVESRRSFLKKAAYAVPTVVALGQITNPVKSSAGSFIGNGKEVPNTNLPAGTSPTRDNDNFNSLFGK
jgi:hypothetical protein